MSVFGSGKSQQRNLACAKIFLHTKDNIRIPIHALITPVIGAPMQNHNRSKISEEYHYVGALDLAPACVGNPFTLDILIGADYYWHIANDEIIRGDGPTCVDTKIGYLISGPTNIHQGPKLHINQILQDINSSVDTMDVSQYWELESLGLQSEITVAEDTNFMEDYITNHVRLTNGKYIADFPWNDNLPLLPTNYATCEKQTRNMIRRLSASQLQAYHQIIMTQFDRGFIEYTPAINHADGHYLCHYGVEKSASSSTPLRIVYRCNHKVGTNPSLNDCLHPGVPLLQDLGGIIMRMRLFPVVLSADIEKAFLHIELNEPDRKYTKFLWIPNSDNPTDGPLVELQFRSIPFGATSSPFILNAVLKKHLRYHESNASVPTLCTDIYVDNLLTSVPDPQTAAIYYTESNEILQKAGFRLRAWASNDPDIQNSASRDDLGAPENIHVNALGMIWDKREDTMSCKTLAPLPVDFVACPKNILSETARLFDVPGFFLPVHVRAKRLLQELQRTKVGFRKNVSDEQRQRWTEIHNDLRAATSRAAWSRLIISGLAPTTPAELHIFADSSKHSYGATSYIVANHQSAILWARNKLIPINDLEAPRIPRYELTSCVLATNLALYVIKQIGPRINIVKTLLWTDSQIVLHWLNSDKKLDRFTKNRVEKIKAAQFSEIRYCPTRDNPADLLTRGLTADQLLKSQLWWRGPSWLTSGRYPMCDIAPLTPCKININLVTALEPIPEEVEIQEPPLTGLVNPTAVLDIQRFSTMRKLLYTTAIIWKFGTVLLQRARHNIRSRAQTPTPPPPAATSFAVNGDALRHARHIWIIRIQETDFHEERLKLQTRNGNKGPLTKQLKLYIDEDDVIRKGSRLHNANIPADCKNPVLLPSDHHFTMLTIREAHSKCLHAGTDITCTQLRQSYWIPHMQTRVRSTLRKCVTCNKINTRAYPLPISAPLPMFRVDTSKPPFYSTGVDYTGGVTVKNKGQEPETVYIVLYTCAVSRAVHLDFVPDLTAYQLLLSLRRFTSRKSTPGKVISDNASYFQCGAEQLQDLFKDPIIRQFFTDRRIQWTFIPKRAPFYGGFWERIIQIVKRTLIKVLRRAVITSLELYTVLTEIEAMLNDRPLTRLGSDPDGPHPVTPAHLLYGRRITPIPIPDTEEEDYMPITTHESTTRRVRYLCELISQYWQRYTSEYLPALRDRHQLSERPTEGRVPAVGEVVLVHEDVIKRPLWKIARITKLLPGRDGLTRAVEIKTARGITSRPINKLYPLELSCLDPLALDHKPDISDLNLGRSTPKRKAALRARENIAAMSNE